MSLSEIQDLSAKFEKALKKWQAEEKRRGNRELADILSEAEGHWDQVTDLLRSAQHEVEEGHREASYSYDRSPKT